MLLRANSNKSSCHVIFIRVDALTKKNRLGADHKIRHTKRWRYFLSFLCVFLTPPSLSGDPWLGSMCAQLTEPSGNTALNI